MTIALHLLTLVVIRFMAQGDALRLEFLSALD